MNIREALKLFIPPVIILLKRAADRQLQILRRYKKPKPVFGFEVHLTDHCNLNCVGCSHFSPLADKYFLSLESYEKDCGRLSELFNREVSVNLMGGEPLLHPELIKFFDITRKYFSSDIVLTTNGILLGKQPPEFWEGLSKNKIRLQITNYPIKIDRYKINDMCYKYGIYVWYAGGDIKTMYNIQVDLEGKQNACKSFFDCAASNFCIHLRDGNLFTCSLIPYVQYFNKYFNKNLLVTENDYINIYKAKSRKEIVDFLSKPPPFCRYCNPKDIKEDVRFAPSKKEISEWVKAG